MKTLSYLISQQIIHPRVPLWLITVCVYVATKLIYQDHNVSYSKHQSTIMTILWLRKHYLTDSQILHLRNTSVRRDKDLLQEIMPMNSVASRIRLTLNEPQQKCIHCNTLCTEKFLTFNKAKYGQNTFVSQMIETDTQNIICNKCHNAICRESLVKCLICTKTE